MDAKATVLQELSKSLGEDSVPATGILEATIRSVLREIGDPKLQINISEILDDLTRQVTSDPFLDSERRRKLQGDIEKVRSESASREIKGTSEARDAYTRGPARSTFSSLFIGVGAMLVTLTSFLAAVLGDKGTQTALSKLVVLHQDFVGVIFGIFGALIVIAIMSYLLGDYVEIFMPRLTSLFRQKKRRK